MIFMTTVTQLVQESHYHTGGCKLAMIAALVYNYNCTHDPATAVATTMQYRLRPRNSSHGLHCSNNSKNRS